MSTSEESPAVQEAQIAAEQMHENQEQLEKLNMDQEMTDEGDKADEGAKTDDTRYTVMIKIERYSAGKTENNDEEPIFEASVELETLKSRHDLEKLGLSTDQKEPLVESIELATSPTSSPSKKRKELLPQRLVNSIRSLVRKATRFDQKTTSAELKAEASKTKDKKEQDAKEKDAEESETDGGVIFKKCTNYKSPHARRDGQHEAE